MTFNYFDKYAFGCYYMNMFRRLLNGLTELIYPQVCLVCKAKLKDKPNIDGVICRECWQRIEKNNPPFCRSCGRHLDKKYIAKNICAPCLRKSQYFDRAFSPCKYEGITKTLIHEFKYKNKEYIGLTLGKLMVEFIKEYGLPVSDLDFIIPVPLHKTRLREREFNQAEILSKPLELAFGTPVMINNLTRNRYTKTQTGLENEKRFANVKGSFTVEDKTKVKGRNILLVDDVLTTSATSSEAAYALKDAGANIVFVLTLAS